VILPWLRNGVWATADESHAGVRVANQQRCEDRENDMFGHSPTFLLKSGANVGL
jgi:hypothetical protein